MRLVSAILGAIVLAGVAEGASAAASFTSRSSTINVTWLYGGGEDSLSGGDQVSSTGLPGVQVLSLSDSFSDASETIHDSPWGVVLGYSATQTITPTWAGSYLAGITASGSSSVSSVVTGDGLADLNVQLPGNQLIVGFQVDSPTAYTLDGTLLSSDGFDANLAVKKPDSEFRIEKFNDLSQSYQIVYFRNSQTDGAETLAVANGSFTAGLYRVTATSKVRAFASEQNSSSWDFSLTLAAPPVPEPAEWVMLLVGLGTVGGLARGRRRMAMTARV